MNEVSRTPFLEPDYRPKIREDGVWRQIGAESVAWHSDCVSPIYLDSAATLITGILDGSGTREELIEDLTDAFGVTAGVATAQLDRVLFQLSGGELLDYDCSSRPSYSLRHSQLPVPDW